MFLDTSVLIAASDLQRPAHSASIPLLAAASKETAACGVDTLAEVYAVLSRLRGGGKQRPELAHMLVLQILERLTVVPLTVEEYAATLRKAARSNLAGALSLTRSFWHAPENLKRNAFIHGTPSISGWSPPISRKRFGRHDIQEVLSETPQLRNVPPASRDRHFKSAIASKLTCRQTWYGPLLPFDLCSSRAIVARPSSRKSTPLKKLLTRYSLPSSFPWPGHLAGLASTTQIPVEESVPASCSRAFARAGA